MAVVGYSRYDPRAYQLGSGNGDARTANRFESDGIGIEKLFALEKQATKNSLLSVHGNK